MFVMPGPCLPACPQTHQLAAEASICGRRTEALWRPTEARSDLERPVSCLGSEGHVSL